MHDETLKFDIPMCLLLSKQHLAFQETKKVLFA